MQRYVFKDDEPIRIKAASKANAQTIGDALEKIRVANSGELEPKAVVDSARNEKHPLHVHFEWDDRVAAESYRLDQARNIIRIVRVVDNKVPDGTTRAFLSVNGPRGVSYRSVSDVKASGELTEALLRQASSDLTAFERRYRELSDICGIVRTAREKIEKRLPRAEARSAA